MESPAPSARQRGVASSPDAGEAGVKVIARFRPLNKMELAKGGKCSTVLTETDVNLTTSDAGAAHSFSFDRVFSTTSTQKDVYEAAAAPLLQNLFQGFNCSLFSYGQTGSGKTHTMTGVIDDDNMKGIIPRSLEAIFNHALAADSAWEFSISVSFVEIYCEKIRDLLEPKNDNLGIGEDPITGVYIKGVTEFYVTSVDEVLTLMAQGSDNRATAATGMNAGSSRSHSLFIVTLTQKNSLTGEALKGKLYLIDLAGSETVSKTGVSGQQLEELKKINKSLSALGNVINALTDGKSTHIPYRDSKLTRILQEALGGNSRTALIINCSPSSYNEQETLSTLRFGKRAKRIVNRAVVNRERSPEELKLVVAALESALVACARASNAWSIAAANKNIVASRVAASGAFSLELLSTETAEALRQAVALLEQSERATSCLEAIREGFVASTPAAGGAGATPRDSEEEAAGGASADVSTAVVPLEGSAEGEHLSPVAHADAASLQARIEALLQEKQGLTAVLEEAAADVLDKTTRLDAAVGEAAALKEKNTDLEEKVKDLNALLEQAQAHILAASSPPSVTSAIPLEASGESSGAATKPPSLQQHEIDSATVRKLEEENALLKSLLEQMEARLDELQEALDKAKEDHTSELEALKAKAEAPQAGAKEQDGDGAKQPHEPTTVFEVLWEHQRLYPLSGWSGDMLPDDPPAWARAAPLPANPASVESVKAFLRLPKTDDTAEEERADETADVVSSYQPLPLPFFGAAVSRIPCRREEVELPSSREWFWSKEWTVDTGGVLPHSLSGAGGDESSKNVFASLMHAYSRAAASADEECKDEVNNDDDGSSAMGHLASPTSLPSPSSPRKSTTSTRLRRPSARASLVGLQGASLLSSSPSSSHGSTNTVAHYQRLLSHGPSVVDTATRDGEGWQYAKTWSDFGHGIGGSTGYHVRRRRWVRARTYIDPNDGNLARQQIMSLAGRLEAQEDMLTHLSAELARKQDTISDYEHRVVSLTQSMAQAVATGDLRWIGQGTLGVAVGERGSRIVAGPPGAHASSSSTSGPTNARSIRGGNQGGAGGSQATSSPAGATRVSYGAGGASNAQQHSSPRLISGGGSQSSGSPEDGLQGMTGAGDFGLFSGLKSIVKRFSNSPNPREHQFAAGAIATSTRTAAPPQHPSDSVDVAALFEACDKSDLKAIEALIKKIPNVGVEDRACRTPLMFAARAGSLEAVKVLVAHGADPTSSDKDGRNALHYAARRGHTSVVSWLLDHGISVTGTDVHALTPLHQAVLGRSVSVAQLLLANGADVHAKDANGCTPLDLALRFESGKGARSSADGPSIIDVLRGTETVSKTAE